MLTKNELRLVASVQMPIKHGTFNNPDPVFLPIVLYLLATPFINTLCSGHPAGSNNDINSFISYSFSALIIYSPVSNSVSIFSFAINLLHIIGNNKIFYK